MRDKPGEANEKIKTRSEIDACISNPAAQSSQPATTKHITPACLSSFLHRSSAASTPQMCSSSSHTASSPDDEYGVVYPPGLLAALPVLQPRPAPHAPSRPARDGAVLVHSDRPLRPCLPVSQDCNNYPVLSLCIDSSHHHHQCINSQCCRIAVYHFLR